MTAALLHFAGVEDFAAAAGEFLAEDPVQRNVIATMVESVRAGRPSEGALWCAVSDPAGRVVGAAMQTPPFGPVLTDMPTESAAQVADLVRRVGHPVPLVSGPGEAVDAFADRWAALTGAAVRPGHALGVLALGELVEPRPVPGRLRPAEQHERALVAGWALEFARDAGLPELGGPDGVARRVLERPGLYLWDDDGPVCLVGHTAPGAGVARVGPVYTPAGHRGRGYASAATAAVSRLLRAAGQRCMLFTDLANPTSNAIYERLGYVRVGEAREALFTPPSP